MPILLVGFLLSLILPGLPLRDTIHLSGSLEGVELADGEIADIEGLEPGPAPSRP